jgi:retinol dehydrogenase 14
MSPATGARRMNAQQASVTAAETPLMAGKVVLITGGSGGIGRATAIGLAALGARVAITGRDLRRTEAAAVEIRGATGNPDVDAFGADLSSQAEVRRLAAEVLEAYPRLDVLVNNVGGSWATRHVTVDGLEHTFALNHLAAFLLTNLLLDRLKASAPARVVTVSSSAQSLGKIDFEDLQGERNYSEQKAYPQSKLASVMFTYELARRLEGTGVTATVLHPGVSRTGFGAEDPSRIFKLLVPLWRPFMKTPQQGAGTSIELASSPKVEGVTGKYFANGRPQTSNKASYDRDAATRLWQVSAGLVGLTAAVQPRSPSSAEGRATYGRRSAHLMKDQRRST